MELKRSVLAGLFVLGVLTANAQYTADYQTNIISGVSSNWSPTYYTVGGVGDVLLIQSNGSLSCFSSYLGSGSGSSNNIAIITGTGSVWTNSNMLIIGNDRGKSNVLIISDGGKLGNDGVCYVGGQSPSRGNNGIIVMGLGSVLQCSTLNVGWENPNNFMEIRDGGTVKNAGGVVGYYDWQYGSSSNRAVVTGPGSTWTIGTLTLGYSSNVNSIDVTNGATLVATTLNVGFGAGYWGDASVGNRLTVDGSSLVVTTGTAKGVITIQTNCTLRLTNAFLQTDNLVALDGRVMISGAATVQTKAVAISSGTNSFLIATTPSQTVLWNMSGGTNVFTTARLVIGAALDSTGIVTVAGGDFTVSGLVCLGSNQFGAGVGTLVVTGRSFRAAGLITGTGGSGSISGLVDRLSFSAGQPVIAVNTPDSLQLGARVVEFFGVSNAVVDWRMTAMTNIIWLQQPSVYRLNMSTNQMAGDTVIGVTNPLGYFGLELVGAGTRWRSSSLVIDQAGSLLLSNVVNPLQTTDLRLTVRQGGQVTSSVAATELNPSGAGFTIVVTDSGSKWVNTKDFAIGYNGANNNLIISNGAGLNNTYGHIGANAGASNNTVIVTGAGSGWTNNNPLAIGTLAPFNRLVISGGGSVYNYTATLGGSPAASNNSVLVTDPNSRWYVDGFTTFLIGNGSSGNSLVVSNGAYVYCNRGADLITGGNSVLVSGTGSVWQSSGDVQIGTSGSNCSLTVCDGGLVRSYYTQVGKNTSNNTLLVTGSGTAFTNSYLYVGNSGFNNRAVIENGAVVVSYGGYVGSDTAPRSNTLVVAGTGSVWRCDWLMSVDTGSGNSLIVSNGGTVITPRLTVNNSSNRLIVADGNLIVDTLVLAPGAASFTGGIQLNVQTAEVDLSPSGFVLGDTPGKTMTSIINGGSFRAGQMIIGAVAGGVGQLVMSNGSLISSDIIYVGSNSVGSGVGSLLVSNGMLRAAGLVSGYDGTGSITALVDVISFSASPPTIIPNSPQSIVVAARVLEFYGVTNALLDRDSSSLTNITWLQEPAIYRLNSATNEMSGSYAFGFANPHGYLTLELVGGRPLWQSDSLTIGSGGTLLISNVVASVQTTAQQLIVTNGGRVVSSVGPGGFNPSTTGFTTIVTGTGSVWSNTGDFASEYAGMGNAFVVKDGGIVYAGKGYVGHSNIASGGSILVSDPGSLWSNRLDMFVGNAGSGHQLALASDGAVFARTGFVGYAASSSNNLVSISGGADWNSLNFHVGYSGSANQLNVFGGGTLVDSSGFLGFNAASSNNTTVLTGPGSAWTNWSTLYVGYGGRGNTLTIDNGATVCSTWGYVGALSSASNNTVTINGTSSSWTSLGGLIIGSRGNQVLLGGGQLITTPIIVSNQNTIAGCGTVTGFVVNNGTITATGCGPLTFLGPVLNSGTLRATGGGVLDFLGPVLSRGSTDFAGGSAIYHEGFIDVSGPTNNWVSGGDGLWTDATSWSLGQAPAGQMAIFLTNGTTKTVTINGSTLGLAPNSFTNYSVILSAPVGTTNTLRLDNAGTNVPFFAVNLTVNPRAELVINNSQISAGWFIYYGTLALDGKVRIENGGVLDGTSSQFHWGEAAPGSSVIITNGGILRSTHAYVGYNAIGSNNTFIVNGTGSVWSNILNIYFGDNSRGNQLFITNNGVVKTLDLYMGYVSTAVSNRINVASTATLAVDQWLWVRRGVLEMRGGTVETGLYEMDDGAAGTISFHAGLLRSYQSIVSNTLPFIVGDGTNTATFELTGGVHSFANGLRIRTNALLTGCGTVTAITTVEMGATVRVSCDGGTLTFTGSTTNNGTMFADNAAFLNFFGPVVNNGVLNGTNVSVHFWSTLQQNGTLIVNDPNSLFSTFGSNTWSSPTGGKWEATANWLRGTPNIEQPTISITNANTKTVTLDAFSVFGCPVSLTVSNLTISAPTGSTNTFRLTGAGLVKPLTISSNVTLAGNAAITVDNSLLTIGGSLNVDAPSNSVSSLLVTNNGIVYAPNAIINTNGTVTLVGGSLSVTNAGTNAVLNIRAGDLTLNGGTATVNHLILTNGLPATITLNAGLLGSGMTSVSNSQTFVIGDGTNAATYQLRGGVHSSLNGWLVRSNAILRGCGTITGPVTVEPGGVVIGDCGGQLFFNNSEILAHEAAAVTPDNAITFTGPVVNNGTVIATNGNVMTFTGQLVNHGVVNTFTGSSFFNGGIVNTGTLTLDPTGDADGDGIPNGWLQQYFGHPLGQASDKSRPPDDATGTGQDNWFKYIAGLDPTNSASVFTVHIARQPANFALTFAPLAAGRTYKPWYSTNVVQGVWLPLTDPGAPVTNGPQITITDTNSAPSQKFYRINISYP